MIAIKSPCFPSPKVLSRPLTVCPQSIIVIFPLCARCSARMEVPRLPKASIYRIVAFPTAFGFKGFRNSQQNGVGDFGTKTFQRRTIQKMSRCGRENITAMKSETDRFKPEHWIIEAEDTHSFICAQCLAIHKRHQPVIRSHKILSAQPGNDTPPPGANAGIDHTNVHRTGRENKERSAQAQELRAGHPDGGQNGLDQQHGYPA